MANKQATKVTQPTKRSRSKRPVQATPAPVAMMPATQQHRPSTRQVATLQRTLGNQALQRFTPPRQAPPKAKPAQAGLDRFTHFSFDWGKVHHDVKLPASIATTLPASIRGVGRLEFKLEISGPVVSFHVLLNGKANLRVDAYSSFNAMSGMAAAGLKFGPSATVRRTLDPQVARDRIEKAGERLALALNNYKQATGDQPEVLAQGPGPQSPFELLKAVGEAIKEMYDTVQAVQGQGKEVPVLELGLEARWSTGVGIQPPTARDRHPDFFGVMATWNF